MIYKNQSYRIERIELSVIYYHGCRFDHCELVYRGDRSPTFQDNQFVDSVFLFTDAAILKIYFLSNLYVHASAYSAAGLLPGELILFDQIGELLWPSDSDH